MPYTRKRQRIHAAVGTSVLALMLTACGGNGDADTDDNGNGASAPTVTVGSGELNASYMCISDPDAPGSMIVSATGTSVDDFGASFGFPDKGDSISATIDDVYWEASDAKGEITSLDLDAENNYASGEATFENSDGETESGTFTIDCS